MNRKLSTEQQEKLRAVAALPDDQIDYTDIPALPDSFWDNAVRNPFYRPTKTATTVRVDSDVLLWLKSKGKGYQTRINSILREEMMKEAGKR